MKITSLQYGMQVSSKQDNFYVKMTDLIELSHNDLFTERNHEVCLFYLC